MDINPSSPAPVTDPQVTHSRYSVSRKGMGGRKPKYTQDQLNAVLETVKSGTSLLQACKSVGPYGSVRAALKREKMWPVVVPVTPQA